MWRQVVAVIAGIIFSFLAAAAGGYLLYQLSGQWPQAGPVLARYVLDPVIALLVGALVGALAKSSPALLAVLSLAPSELVPLVSRRLNAAHLLLMVLLAVFCLLIGAASAWLTFRSRARSTQSVPAGT
jgi:hypothetical protein